ncbi:ATPase, T2SS/T4P/T4SS family [uncultured Methanofollis sp.]|uniref:ATPase, T2SS/T4P/T4SS family n=1 Tax=uncultured Methanofollis sp. TaxID=262500 RepID=UPI00262091B5|nr:ATPase, T2SS/T4P/T4SS family [uncultured Methanofollis sp.]
MKTDTDAVHPAGEEEKNVEDETLTSLRSMVEGKKDLDIHSMIRDVRSMREVSGEIPEETHVQTPPAAKYAPAEDIPAAPPVPAEEIAPAPEDNSPAPAADDTAVDLDKLQDMLDSIFDKEVAAASPAATPVAGSVPSPDPAPQPVPSAGPAAPKKTRWSEGAIPEVGGDDTAVAAGITDAEDIDALSELILPKAATFDVEELTLDQASHDAPLGMGSLPPEIDTLWKEAFPTITEEARSVVIGKDTEKKGGIFGKINLFTNKLTRKVEEYNPRVHGPLVDLAFTPEPGVEEIELYPVNEPYAYIRIIYDNTSHEYTYEVLEPVLSSAEQELLREIKGRLFEQLDVNTKDISREGARKVLRDLSDTIILDYGINLTPVTREKIFYHIERDFLGDGLIDAIMHDKFIEDISCDGLDNPIFVFHGGYESIKTNMMYTDAVELDSFVTKLAQRAGKYISIAEPMLDATMTDGSRIQMTLGKEVTAHGSTFTIRKFKDEPITPTDLIEWGTFSPLSVAFLWLAVEAGNSAIFAGGTASGKTTALNAISLFIPPLAKIVSLEDTRELKLPHPNWIPSVTRDSFDTGGKGAIDMYELLRAALRQRPEYICVGEVRGKEAQTLFQAMSTGHVTYATMHADSVASVVHRLENPPLDVPRNMLNALNLVCIQVQARVGGQRIRRNKQIIEILDIDPRTNELITNEVFSWHQATDEIRYSGKSYVLETIMETRGWSEARMREELKRRQEILEWMRRQKIRHFRDVSKMLISYFRDPDAVMEIVRHDLYGEGASQ